MKNLRDKRNMREDNLRDKSAREKINSVISGRRYSHADAADGAG